MENWGEVIWTDESRFEVGHHEGTCWIYRAVRDWVQFNWVTRVRWSFYLLGDSKGKTMWT